MSWNRLRTLEGSYYIPQPIYCIPFISIALEAMARLVGWFLIIYRTWKCRCSSSQTDKSPNFGRWKLYFLLLKILILVTLPTLSSAPDRGFCIKRPGQEMMGFTIRKRKIRDDHSQIIWFQWFLAVLIMTDYYDYKTTNGYYDYSDSKLLRFLNYY